MNKRLSFGIVANAVAIVVLLWFFASFIDVNVHNLGDCQYAAWNLFNVFQ